MNELYFKVYFNTEDAPVECHIMDFPTGKSIKAVVPFTGVKDKNGNRIYVNDFINTEDVREIGWVVFDNGCFAVKIFNEEFKEVYFDLLNECSCVQVIGNKYTTMEKYKDEFPKKFFDYNDNDYTIKEKASVH